MSHIKTTSDRSRGPEATRRAFVAGAAAIAVAGPAFALAGCSSADAASPAGGSGSSGASSASSQAGASSVADKPSASSASSADASGASDARGGAGNILVAYFSATGHTQAVAETVAEELGADLFALTPSTPYTRQDLDYNDQSSRVCAEVGERDTIDVALDRVTPEGWGGYDTVFVGYPIWWQDFSWVMGEFLAGNDFTGKTVVPFCTSAASPLGESDRHAAQAAGTGDWLPGVRFPGGVGKDDVLAWLDSLEV